MPPITDVKPAFTLPAARIALGAGAYAAPELTGKLLGLSLGGNHEATLFARVFGVRDAALGVGALMSGNGGRRMWLGAGLACDLADATAGVIALRSGAPKFGAIATIAAASSGIALSIAALATTRKE
jgi:hypothetical protein